MILHLGVNDKPYAHKHGETTGDVAVILEKGYGVMATFYERNEEHILGLLADAFGDQAVEIMNSTKVIPVKKLFKNACSQIDKDFRKFINTKEMDFTVHGVPTKASLAGISSRFKYGTRKKASSKKVCKNFVRPSFDDTHLYKNSFRSWMSD
jgi:hypothetical protein